MGAPVTSRVRGHGFEVALTGEKISGVVLCHQVKTIDFVERGLKFAEKAPASVVSEVLAKVRAICNGINWLERRDPMQKASFIFRLLIT